MDPISFEEDIFLAPLFATGGYLCLLELGNIFSLIPAQFEQSVNAQISTVSQIVAVWSFIVLIWWGTSACISMLLSSSFAARSSTAAPLIYLTSAILKDALLNRADGSALDRMKQDVMFALSFYWKSTCALFLCAFIASFICVWKAVQHKILPRDPWEDMWEDMCREDMDQAMTLFD